MAAGSWSPLANDSRAELLLAARWNDSLSHGSVVTHAAGPVCGMPGEFEAAGCVDRSLASSFKSLSFGTFRVVSGAERLARRRPYPGVHPPIPILRLARLATARLYAPIATIECRDRDAACRAWFAEPDARPDEPQNRKTRTLDRDVCSPHLAFEESASRLQRAPSEQKNRRLTPSRANVGFGASAAGCKQPTAHRCRADVRA